jgi:ribosomal small subunit protein bTHX
MGRGDKRSAKGKRTVGSYGNSRPQRVKKTDVTAKPKVEKAVKAPKKVAETAAVEKPKKAPAKKKKAEGSEE